MSQNDLSIANQGFASFRSDLNSALQALASTNSGTSAPSTTYANQLFYDTTNNILKIRNEDNDAFISLFTLDQTNDNIESLTIDGAFTAVGALSAKGGAVFNEDSANVDFRVESNNNANMLFVDGADDRVGIGTATFGASSHKLEVDGGSGETRLRISSTGTDLREAGIILANSSKSNDNDGIVIAHGGASTTFDDLGGNELLRLSQSSNKMSFKLGANNEGFISNTNNNQTDVLMLLRDTSGSGGTAVRFRTGTSQVGTITINTNSTAYNTSSDYRLKENVDYTFDATTRLKQVKPARFNFISDDTNTLVDGFLAHEVSHDADGNPLVPEAIYGSKDAVEVWKANEELPDGVSVGDNKLDGDGNTIPDYQGIDQSKLVPLLTKALQEQQATIEALTARITALEEA